MDYEIRPMDLKHATLLPVGTEGEFKIKARDMLLTMPEGGDRKTRSYEVVSMTPAADGGSSERSQRPPEDRPGNGRASSEERSSDHSSSSER